MNSSETAQTVLVIAAHPDDELLGAGATFAKRLRLGDSVHVAIVCGHYASESHEAKQQSDAQIAAKTMGFTSFRCLMLPDQGLDTVPQIELNKELVTVIDDVRPDIVYTHYAGDLNLDHQLIHDSVMVATRPNRRFIREVLGFETPSATGMWTGHAFDPDTFEIITDEDLAIKLAAMACYETEALPSPHPRSIESLRHRAHYWGNIVHQAAAEPFMTLRRLHY